MESMFYLAIFICLFSTTFGTFPENGFSRPVEFLTSYTPFVNNFLIRVQNSDVLQNIFASAAEESKNYDGVYNMVFEGAIQYKVTHPLDDAKSLADVHILVADTLNSFKLSKIYSSAFEGVLRDRQLTTTTNAVELAEMLVNSLLEKKRFVGLVPSPSPYKKVLMDGAMDVFQNMNINPSEGFGDLNRHLVNGFDDLIKSN